MTTYEVVIPVLNEERTLRQNVTIVQDFLSTMPDRWRDVRLAIADNGSMDRTRAIADELAVEFSNLRVVRLREKGVGRALKAAWTTSEADVVGYMDLDLATDLKHLPEAFQAIEGGADIVYGSRLARNSKVVGRTVRREVISRIFNGILKVYMGARFSDGMCGFKFLRRDLVETLIAEGAESDGWFFATEFLLVGQHRNLRLSELPVHWTDDPDSRVKAGKLAIEYMKAMRKLRRRQAMRAGT